MAMVTPYASDSPLWNLREVESAYTSAKFLENLVVQKKRRSRGSSGSRA